MYNKKFMDEAIRVSLENIDKNGGPFGAVIVKDGEIIASTGNRVTANNDPTAHAEVNAIRLACQKLGTFNLQGCEIYSSCEPCPMCLSAIYWAHIDTIYYANTHVDAAEIGFDDSFIYDELAKNIDCRKIKSEQHDRDTAIKAFDVWKNKIDKEEY
ncbi:MAG: nucleoside deaminase [Candidatus Aphodosoma sp.]